MQYLYYLIIYPIEYLLELIFNVINYTINIPGLSIIAVSFVMNICILPMYNKADSLQEKERRIQKDMADDISHIKNVFTGDERFMMLQAYYRTRSYKPVYALRGAVSLLLQIPFFMAAYLFLSTLPALNGAAFGPIKDLSHPDGLITLGGLSVNFLPILMTIVNLVSTYVYTNGSSRKEKVQLVITAIIFLVLLYQSPSGLVIYWTCNNLFSLFKNILRRNEPANSFVNNDNPAPEKSNTSTYFLWAVFMSVFVGMVIPATVIKSSPEEFIDYSVFSNPIEFIFVSASISLGMFVLWGGILYLLSQHKHEKAFNTALLSILLSCLANYALFGRHYGNMSADMVYDVLPKNNLHEAIINIGIILFLTIAAYIFWEKNKLRVVWLYTILTISALILFAKDVFDINTHMSEFEKPDMSFVTQTTDEKVLQLSATGKNVIVIMLDRTVGSYLPYIFDENPELYEQYSGFTYYPSTVSFGPCTNYGAPGLFGGYEYTPSEMNKRSEETLAQKHNEALKLMPKLFSDHGFRITVCDPPYAGYREIPDLSIFDSIKNTNAYNLKERFRTNGPLYAARKKIRQRNIFSYSLFRTLPVFAREWFYNGGVYWGPTTGDLSERYDTNYTILDSLESITDIRQDIDNAFLMMDNEAPHEPANLQLPDYVPSEHVDNTSYLSKWLDQFEDEEGNRSIEFDKDIDFQEYFSTAAVLIRLGEYLDYLKEQKVYDNSRIIIVSDHGIALGQFKDLMFDGIPGINEWTGYPYLDVEGFNPLLMVKDFQSTEFSVDESFMTNADVPAIAFKGIIDNPVNPFTGKPISNDMKNAGLFITASNNHKISDNDGCIYETININDGKPAPWYILKGNPLEQNSWTYIGTELKNN